MISRVVTLFLISLLILFSSCAPKQSEVLIAEFDAVKIDLTEFETAYLKNAGGVEQARKDSLEKFKNFLDLYVNFKMKLKDAEERGYENNNELMDELEDYKKKVGITFLLEREIVDPGIQKLFERRKEELRVSHIMIRVDTSGEEAARQLAYKLLDSIKNGADFAELAEDFSQDGFSKNQGGDIYFFTAGQIPYEFEEAAYLTPAGQIYSDVIKTKFGYHILKVTERQPRIPQIRASHILIDFMNNNNEYDSVSARIKADSILQQIRAGADFGEMAKKYSADNGSAPQGGDLGFFARRAMVKDFDEAAFRLDAGEVSEPVKTSFGFHLIKVTSKMVQTAFEAEKEELKKIFRQTRYQAEYDSLISKLRKKYNYKQDNSTFAYILDTSDSVKFGSAHPSIEELKNSSIFYIDGKGISAADFMNRLDENADFQNKLINSESLSLAVNSVSADYLLEEEALSLEKTNHEFADLMKDYRNGIYIFKLQEEEVWNKIEIDSVKLYDYYLTTKDKYVWSDRVTFKELFARKDSSIQHYYSLLQQGENFDSLVVRYTERPGYKDKAGLFSLQDAKSSQLAEEAYKLRNPGGYSAPFSNSGGYSIVQLIQKEPSRIKTFEEARAEVSGAFQEEESKRLENAYLKELEKKYAPVIYHQALEKAFKSR